MKITNKQTDHTLFANTPNGIHSFFTRMVNHLAIMPLTLTLLLGIMSVEVVWGQQSITTAGSAVNQNFDEMSTSSTATLPTGFKIGTDWSTGTTATTLAYGSTGTGAVVSNSAGGAINWANGITGSATDRALGFLSTGGYTSPRSIIYAFTNNTGSTVTSISLSWNYEKYRSGSRAFDWTFFHGSTSTASTANSSGDQAYAADANNTTISNPPASTAKSFTISSLSIANGSTYYLRWTYTGSGGSSNGQGLGIDDFSITLIAPTAPTLTTPTVSSIATTSATLGATVSSDGGAALSARGTVWGTSASPTGNALAEGGTAVAAFSHSRTGLTANTVYTYRGYATNSAGTGYSADGTFTTLPLAPTVGTGNSITASGFTANWSHPTMGSASYTYTVEVDDDSNFGSINTTVSSIASSSTSQAITGLTASTTYYYRVKAVNTQGSSVWSLTSAGITTSSAATPTLNPVTLASALSTTYGTASAGVSFAVGGSNLTTTITVTPQSGYEIATSSGGTYQSTAMTGIANGTTLWVRFASTPAAGTYNSSTAVVLSGGGASSNVNITTSSSGNTVAKATPTITLAPTATAIIFGQTLASSTISGGTASVAGSFAFTTPSTAPNAGTANQSVTFNPTDNANYNTTTTDISVTVNKANQTITFGSLADKTTADAPFNLTATASSGLTVTYTSSNTAVASISGSTVTIVGAGQTTITASQGGDGNYNAATNVPQNLTVTLVPSKIAGWDFDGLSGFGSSPQAATNSDANVTVGGLTRSDFGTSGSSAANAWGGTGNGTATFTVKANTGYTLSLSEISAYNVRRSGTGATTGQWAYSLDGTNFTNIGSAITWGGTTTATGNAQSAISLIGISALQNLSSATTVTFRIVNTGASGTGTWYLNDFQTGDDFVINGYVEVEITPVITVTPSSLSGFTQNSSTPSSEQTYTVSGNNLNGDVIITPPTGYEVSTTTGGSFSATNPITLSVSGGNIVDEPVTIYVRQSSSILGAISGNITHASAGSNNPTVALSGIRTGSYYSKSTGNLDDVNTWGLNTDGTGTAPSNFIEDGAIYEIRNRATATIGANWTVSGAASKVVVGDGTNAVDFTIPSGFVLTGTIDVSDHAELTIENTTSPTLGTLAPQSTLEYNNVAVTLSTSTAYRNLKLSGSGAKTFPGGTTTITGDLTFNGCALSGASISPFSTILSAGNITYVGTVTPPADGNSITLSTNGSALGTQTITGAGNTVRWFRITTTTANTILLSTTGGSSNLLLGNSAGGGITLADGSVLNMNGNSMILFNNNSANAFILNGNSSISTTATTNFTIERSNNTGALRFTPGSNTIGNLTVNLTGGSSSRFELASSLIVAGTLTLSSGTIVVGPHTLTISESMSRTSGNIDASDASATVEFKGTTSQNIPPATFTGEINNLTVDNAQGVFTNQPLTIHNTLSLASGFLSIGANLMQIQGNISGSGSIRGSNQSAINIAGSGGSVNLRMDQTTRGVTNRLGSLTYNRTSHTITLLDTVEIVGLVTPQAGQLNTQNMLKLISTALGTARIATGSGAYITGNVVAERFVPATGGRRWRFMSSPVANATIEDWRGEIFITGGSGSTTVGTTNTGGFDASPNNSSSIFSYNETDPSPSANIGWVAPISTSHPLTAGKGYRVFVRGDRSNTAALTNVSTPMNAVTMNVVGAVNTGNITIPITCTASGAGNTYNNLFDGWNLIGNPYPSDYNWNAFYDANKVALDAFMEPVVWLYDATNGGYISYNANQDVGGLSNGIIPSGAAFWVKAKTLGSHTITLTESFKTDIQAMNVFKNQENGGFVVRMVRDSINSSELHIKYKTGATTNFDQMDIQHLSGTVNIAAYDLDSIRLAASVRPLTTINDTIRLDVWGSSGNYSLMFLNPSYIDILDEVYLIDNHLNQTVNLKQTNQYNFIISSSIPSTFGANRFMIVVANANPVPVALGTLKADVVASQIVELSWTTLSEINSSHFQIEHSNDANTFYPIGKQHSMGNTTTPQHYKFLHYEPEMNNYYRLKIIDKDGSYSYSHTVAVDIHRENYKAQCEVFPNPSNGTFTVLSQAGSSFRLTNIHGHTIQEGITRDKMQFHKLDQGIYILQIMQSGNITNSTKIVVTQP